MGMGVYSYIGFRQGDPKVLAIPFDPDGNRCGLDKGFENHTYIYFAKPFITEGSIPTVCVSKCPNY